MGTATKNFLTRLAVQPAPVRVRSQRPLAPNATSVPSVANDNEMISGAVHRSFSICLKGEENLS